MGILDSIGRHAELMFKQNAEQHGSEDNKNVFPVNTADDVYVDDDGNVLTDMMSTVVNIDDDVIGAMTCVQDDVIEVSDTLYNLLTT